MQTLKTFSRAKLDDKNKKEIEDKLDVSITQNSQGYWVIRSANPQIETLAIREFNRKTHPAPILVSTRPFPC